MSNVEDTTRTLIKNLEGTIKNCRHGGPLSTEQNTPWFSQCNQLAMCDPVPIDVHISSIGDDDDTIRSNLMATVRIVEGFRLCLSHVESRKYFASLAVDAWFNEDYSYTRKFLIKSLILYHLQGNGVTKVMRELSEGKGGRNSLFSMVKGVLTCQEGGLKSYLELCTEGSCKCIQLAQIINDERESIFGTASDRDAEAHRVQRLDERLPTILKASSELWTIKKKAAQYLKENKLKESKRMYLKAEVMLEQHRKQEYPIHEKEMQFQIGEEVGKVASNLSMICLKCDEKEEALKYANKAVTTHPAWGKGHSRRALALMALERYDEAHVAIFNAIKRCEKLVLLGDELVKQRQEIKEYKKIQADIQDKLGDAREQQFSMEDNPLYKPLSKPQSDGIDTGSMLSMINHGVMDEIYSFMAPQDVAKLECTCKRFAISPERGRRIAIATRCYAHFLDSEIYTINEARAVKKYFERYVGCGDPSPRRALREFIVKGSKVFDNKGWMECIYEINFDPLSLKTIFETAFNEPSAVYNFDQLSSRRDFITAKYLIREGKMGSCWPFMTMLGSSHFETSDGKPNDLAIKFIMHGLDVELMRLTVSLDEYDDDIDNVNLRQSVMIQLNNIILAMGSRLPPLTVEHPLFTISMECHSLYTEHVPDDWPGVDDSFTWDHGPVEKTRIKQYWKNEPAMLFMWRSSILKLLKWVHDLEKGGYAFEFLLRNRRIFGKMAVEREAYPNNNFSFGSFLVMKAFEYGGAVSLSVKLKTRSDLTHLFVDYYDFLHVFSKGYPALISFRDTMAARHYSHRG